MVSMKRICHSQQCHLANGQQFGGAPYYMNAKEFAVFVADEFGSRLR